jgi:REP element-mobilizing transposase RayT
MEFLLKNNYKKSIFYVFSNGCFLLFFYSKPKNMRYKILDQNGLNYLTLTILEWIDLFTRPVYSEMILNSLRYCQEHKELKVHAFVIMPSHLHLILSTPATTGLSSILQSFKSFTAKQILKYLKELLVF